MKLVLQLVCGSVCLLGTAVAADPLPQRRALGALELDAITAGATAGAAGGAIAIDPTFATTETNVGAALATRTYGGGYTGSSAASGAVAGAYTAGGGPRGAAATSSASTPEGPAGSSVIAIDGSVNSGSATYAISARSSHSILWHGF